MDFLPAFERLDNYDRCLHREWEKIAARRFCAYEKEIKKRAQKYNNFIHIIISSPFPLVKSRARTTNRKKTTASDHHKNSYKLFKLNKKATIFSSLLFITLRAVESNMRGLFIIVFGHSTSEATATATRYVFTQKQSGRRGTERDEEKAEWKKKRTEQTPCSMLMTIHVKTRNRGKLRTEAFSRNEFLNKRRRTQARSSCLTTGFCHAR